MAQTLRQHASAVTRMDLCYSAACCCRAYAGPATVTPLAHRFAAMLPADRHTCSPAPHVCLPQRLTGGLRHAAAQRNIPALTLPPPLKQPLFFAALPVTTLSVAYTRPSAMRALTANRHLNACTAPVYICNISAPAGGTHQERLLAPTCANAHRTCSYLYYRGTLAAIAPHNAATSSACLLFSRLSRACLMLLPPLVSLSCSRRAYCLFRHSPTFRYRLFRIPYYHLRATCGDSSPATCACSLPACRHAPRTTARALLPSRSPATCHSYMLNGTAIRTCCVVSYTPPRSVTCYLRMPNLSSNRGCMRS